ncbi:MAG: hypothetical protein AB1498_06160 [bacterium]
MTSDYGYRYEWFEALKKDREENARVLEKPSLEETKRIVSEMYSKQAHFIYELLQNASDAKATKIKFVLKKNGLIFKHNGAVRFSISDPQKEREDKKNGKLGHINAITSVAQTSKGPEEIGKFGLGFKAVFKYTETPEIYDPNFKFKIERFIVPVEIEKDHELRENEETLFYFPFNLSSKPSKDAYEEIMERLKQLENPLLFLAGVIEWSCEGNESGVYYKDEKAYPIIDTIEEINGDVFSRKFLVFKSNKNCYDARIAYPIVKENDKEVLKSNQKFPAYYFFPTKESTELKFILHGRFDLTENRENIRENSWNKEPIKELASLVCESLPIIKSMGWLNAGFLEILPLDCDSLHDNHMFRPIYDAVRNALFTQPLLPTNDGGFVSANQAKLARGADLRNLLSSDQLQRLFSSERPLRWITGEITKDSSSDLHSYLIKELNIQEVTPEMLAGKLTEIFLEAQTDEEMIELYKFFLNKESLWRSNMPFIRRSDNQHVKPFKDNGDPNIYISLKESSELPIVKQEIVRDEQARDFLKKLGIPELDNVAEIIGKILPKYKNGGVQLLSDEEHKNDIFKILQALKTDSQTKKEKLINEFKETPFLLAKNASSMESAYRKPGEIYFRSADLEIYFQGNPNAWFLNEPDAENNMVFKELGVADSVRVKTRSTDRVGNVIIRDEHRRNTEGHIRGLHGFDPDCTIDGLEHALSQITKEKAIFIWNRLAIPNINNISGTIEKSKYKDYKPSDKQGDQPSKMGELLRSNAWLPGDNGKFVNPREITLESLPSEFESSKDLAGKLMMKSSPVETDEIFGFNRKDIFEAIEQDPDWLRELMARQSKKPEFPDEPVSYSSRREGKVTEEIEGATVKSYGPKVRSVRTSENSIDPVTWLRNQYTNSNEEMICQICKDAMPFKKRDGQYYFEKVEILSRDHFTKEHVAQWLALCPECAARYHEFIKNDPEKKEMQKIKSALVSDKPEISISLGELKTTIRFTDKHFSDLKTITKNYDKDGGRQ